ncbi:Card1-like endonuclease domain-containing protein [Nostoc sp.]|uniref:Card1-like endonuclease domain-containing protein n=1 Tax=Nostoc sp. TaxID=1180 RepID=UPI002FF7573D
MCIDREDNERIRLKIKPDTLPVELVTIFQLHGLELKQKPTQQAQLPKLATELANVLKEESKSKQWFDWFYNVFREQAYRKKSNSGGDWKSETSLIDVSTSLEKLPKEIVVAFKQENFLINENELSLQQVQKTGVFQKIKHFCEWLDGLWLEHYVLEQVQNIAKKQLIEDYRMNFAIPLTGTRDGFQFDVAFTRGYQLFAISCTTTSKRDLCKSKLFEAYLRARQMGGDEARVALICCSNEPDTLKAEILASINDKKIAVFGREHLANLSEEIDKWITQVDREAK